jgi:hypothetical protein
MFGLIDRGEVGQGHGFLKADDLLTIDGNPAVVWTDTAEGVAYLLDTILPSTAFAFVPPMNVVYAIIHLADKYQFEQAYEQAVKYVLKKFPSAWERLVEDPDLRVYDDLETATYVIQCSRGIGNASVLPLAFYALATKSWKAKTSSEYVLLVEELGPVDIAESI